MAETSTEGCTSPGQRARWMDPPWGTAGKRKTDRRPGAGRVRQEGLSNWGLSWEESIPWRLGWDELSPRERKLEELSTIDSTQTDKGKGGLSPTENPAWELSPRGLSQEAPGSRE